MPTVIQRFHFEYTVYITPCGDNPIFGQGDKIIDFYVNPEKFPPNSSLRLEQNQIAFVKADIAEWNYTQLSNKSGASVEDIKNRFRFFVRIENIFPCELIDKNVYQAQS